MGLASALSTALTGLSAAETTIDVVGNNLANSNTVGFKASHVEFATQLLQTLSLGSAPTSNNGGTNPRQIGLGTRVAGITPDFTQGAVEISASPLDMALQGDGFFIVRGPGNEQFYTRNGVFKLNADNEIVTVTGHRVLGYGVNDQYEMQSVLDPIEIPVGQELAAEATQNVFLEGVLSPIGDVADTPEITETDVLRNGAYAGPADPPSVGEVAVPGNLDGEYTYYVTFSNGVTESLFSPISGEVTVNNEQVELTDLPPAPPGNPAGWTERRIYRNTAADPDTYHLVSTINDPDTTTSFTDNVSDAAISGNPTLDLDSHQATGSTRLVDVLRHNGETFENVFEEGTLRFAGRKGGRTLGEQEFEITDSTTFNDLATFLEESLGIQTSSDDPSNPLGQSDPPGVEITGGRIVVTSNAGEPNAVEVPTSGMQLERSDGSVQSVDLPFASTQSAVGSGTTTDFIAYDSLGAPVRVRLTAVLESRDDSSATFRWFAESPDNDPLTGHATAVGNGTITFDGEGNFIGASGETVTVDRQNLPSNSPLTFDLDFSQLSGLAADSSLLGVNRQDGFPPGVLTNFLVGENGTINGVFSNGVFRTIGQIRLARFSNPAGLDQRGDNLFSEGINSGLPIMGNPGEQGIGTILEGAVELSNTDIGSDLIELVLASTMYRGNTRVISTAQQMIDELLAIRR